MRHNFKADYNRDPDQNPSVGDLIGNYYQFGRSAVAPNLVGRISKLTNLAYCKQQLGSRFFYFGKKTTQTFAYYLNLKMIIFIDILFLQI